MVYCGKPSKGCSNCRERKIRCDQREPGCGQCEKRQQQCPGYRNLVDLMFRDESSHVIKKAKAKARRKVSSGGNTSPDPGSTPESVSGMSGISGISGVSGISGISGASGASGASGPSVASGVSAKSPTLPFVTISGASSSSSAKAAAHPDPPPKRRAKKRLSLLTPSTCLADPSLRLSFSRRSQSQDSQDDSLLPSPDGGSWPKTPQIAVWYSLEPTCQERGTAYFFSRYVSIDENACHQRFDFIYDIWKPGSSLASDPQVDSVMASMTAVGLVGLANMTHSPEVMESARKSYGTALTLINQALKVPREAVKDTTMLSILILSLFEMVAADVATLSTIKAWQRHVSGAAEVARMRGVDQLRTRAGARMFMMLCQSVMISCIQQGLPMPPALVDLRAELLARKRLSSSLVSLAASASSVASPASRGTSPDPLPSSPSPSPSPSPSTEWSIDASTPLYRVLEFRHEAKSGRFESREAMLDRLIEMDGEFERVAAGLPESWRWRTFRAARPHKAVFGDVCHVYPTVAKAAAWNGIRSCRLLILETTLTELHGCYAGVNPALVPARFVDAFGRARLRLAQLCAEVLASVPQHSGLIGPPGEAGATSTPLQTVEVRAPATPPQSPESTGCSAASAPSSSPAAAAAAALAAAGSGSGAGAGAGMYDHDDQLSGGGGIAGVGGGRAVDDSGPTLLDPTRARDAEEEARRIMLLASASNTIVWPLYHVGMASTCPPAMRTYCVERLEAICEETGLSQASTIAGMLQGRQVAPRWMELTWPLVRGAGDSGGGSSSRNADVRQGTSTMDVHMTGAPL